MTFEEIERQARSLVAGRVSWQGPSTLLWQRIAQRQQEIVAKAAEANRGYFLTEAVAFVDNSRVELRTLMYEGASGSLEVSLLDRIFRVEVEESGTSPWTPGTEIHVVPVLDPGVAFPPRMVLVGSQLRAVGGDLQGVDHVRIFYQARPSVQVAAETESVLPDPYGELLVYDLAKFMLLRIARVKEEDEDPAYSMIRGLEKSLEAQFLEHVSRFALGQKRFLDS
jgi:hypothetical protein